MMMTGAIRLDFEVFTAIRVGIYVFEALHCAGGREDAFTAVFRWL